jgi:hypothetical protein
MIRVLALHKREISDKEFLDLLYNRYPTLKENKDIWKVTVARVEEKIKKKLKYKFDRIYYDKQSTNVQAIMPYVLITNSPQVIEIDFEHELLSKRRKLSTFVTMKGTLNEKNGKSS